MKTQQTHLASLFGFLLFILGALLLFLGGLLLGLSAITEFFIKNQTNAQSTVFFVVLSFEGALLLGAAIIAFLKFLNKPAAEVPMSFPFSWWHIAVGIVGSGLALWIGSRIQSLDSVNWIVLPFLTIPAIILPLWMILGIGTRNTPPSSRWRTCGVFGLSMTLVPFILLILEVFIGFIVAIMAAVYIVSQPDLMTELQRLFVQFQFVDPQSEEALKLLAPLATRPSVVITILVYLAVFVPLVEELFKPLGVWMLGRKLNSASQGFALGALSGAGYALMETANVSGQVGEWGSLLLARIGTGLLHITTSALMGAAIVMAWRERRTLRLLGTYLAAILLHGLWNTVAVAYGVSNLGGMFDQTDRFDSIHTVATVLMGILAVVLLATLLTTNSRLRDNTATPAIPETTPTTNAEDNPGS